MLIGLILLFGRGIGFVFLLREVVAGREVRYGNGGMELDKCNLKEGESCDTLLWMMRSVWKLIS